MIIILTTNTSILLALLFPRLVGVAALEQVASYNSRTVKKESAEVVRTGANQCFIGRSEEKQGFAVIAAMMLLDFVGGVHHGMYVLGMASGNEATR